MKNITTYSGEITYEKENLKCFSNNRLLYYRKNQVSVISQNDDLFENLTVLENLTLFYYEKDVVKLLSQLSLSYLKDRYVYTLSGGERQRIYIIKAALSSCNVLLCDEITSALDKENAKKIIEFVLNVFNDKTVIFISHDPEIFDLKIDHLIKIDKNVEL